MRATTSLLALLSLGGALGSASDNSTSVPWSNLSISAEGRNLYRTSSGEPFFWQADTAWELFHRLNRSDIDHYLQDRASKGFNVVQSVVISELNGTTYPNFYGELPLHDADPLRPNDAYFAHVDWAVRRAASYGILVALVPTWGRWVNCGWHNGAIIFNESSAESFGHYIGHRYPGLPKIIGGDSNGLWACNASAAQEAFRADQTVDQSTLLGPITDTRSVWARMAEGFAAAESNAGATPFVTWHPTNMWIATPATPLPYGHNYMANVSMDAVQSGHNIPDNDTVDTRFAALRGWDSTRNYANVAAMRAAFAGPVVDLENHYEGAFVGFNASRPLWNASHVRHGFYNARLAGACGFTYGANAVWQMYAPRAQLARPDLFVPPQIEQPANESWRDALAYPGATQSGFVQRLFAGLDREDLESLRPDRGFVASADVLAYEGNRYVAGLVSRRQYWVYAGYGDAFDLDLDALRAHFGKDRARARWYDPRQGVYRNETGSARPFGLEGRKAFVPPTSGGVDDDWVLELNVAA
ncbi:uncharacterized protein BKCO1_2700067 [Diplodia corticola]|uniref:DUF4038 domain-containing protein n=1 Tax=Diplodia corticola TaxID=236234 RepID=A0A1J9QZH1_9PEZI|nr:uncharacterized protein BKCO1_2700067 [Diplodia corticola]OJD33769.1 hypothetical protein BKCO1_2700067 [Diplodia corticola]